MSRLVLATNQHINPPKELVAMDKIFNCGERKKPSNDAIKKFLDVYIQIANRVRLDRNNEKKETNR
ncbi:hypothetical protein [Siminovitchia fortis]|uniref:hypothetical protein n=1 Tax=Siminovitchia fortis TaxID=254758 RepID=UPI0011A821C3|nr:hypothetical protein [Siminovitchia fortis]